MSRILRYTAVFLVLFVLVALLFINQGLAGIAGSLYPGATPYAYGGLLALEALAVVWFWRGIFGRQQHLRFTADPSEEERRRFARVLTVRLRANPLLRGLEYTPSAPDYAQQCLAVLRGKADAEIRGTAERIFLATALSQNGRIDALIVFISLCRLVWRISGIYNQRPHPAEVVSLYWAVASSTFLALSFEELDISTEITVGFGEAFHAMAPATMTGSVPFVGTALQKFTSSAIDGAANCFLALRAGIIARNAFTYALEEREQPRRAAIYKEAGGILLEMSGMLIDQFTKSLGERLWGLGHAAKNKTVQAGQNFAGGVLRVGEGISSGAGKAASATVGAVHSTGGALAQAGQATGNAVLHAGQFTGGAVKQAGQAAAALAGAAAKTGQSVADAVVKTGHTVAGSAVRTGQAVGETVSRTGQAVADAAVKTGQTAKAAAGTAVAAGEAVAQATAKTGKMAVKAAAAVGQTVTDTVRQTGRVVSAPFRGKPKRAEKE